MFIVPLFVVGCARTSNAPVFTAHHIRVNVSDHFGINNCARVVNDWQLPYFRIGCTNFCTINRTAATSTSAAIQRQ